MPDSIQSLAKGLVAIGLALAGYGYWSLTWGTVGATALAIPVYWIASGWRPGFRVSAAAARRLLPFGAHVVGIDLLGALVRNVDYLFVGRLLGRRRWGSTRSCFRIPPTSSSASSVSRSDRCCFRSMPGCAKTRPRSGNLPRHRHGYVTAFTAPMAIGLALVAEPFVITAFGERWREVAAVIPSICCYALFISSTHNVGDLYKALGRPELLTRLATAAGGSRRTRDLARGVGRRQRSRGRMGAGRNRRLRHRRELRRRESCLRAARAAGARATLPIAAACVGMAVVVLTLRSLVAGRPAVVQLGLCVRSARSPMG